MKDMTSTKRLRMEEFDYPLPDERIAKFPLAKRDESKLLLCKSGEITETCFNQITTHLPENALVVSIIPVLFKRAWYFIKRPEHV